MYVEFGPVKVEVPARVKPVILVKVQLSAIMFPVKVSILATAKPKVEPETINELDPV